MNYKHMIDNFAYFAIIYRQIFSGYDASQLNLPINKTQEKVLTFIKHNPDKNMSEISKISGLEKGSFTTLIDNLIGMGLVTRKRSETDRRVNYLSLTEEGSSLVDRIIQSLDEYLDQKFSVLSSSEKIEFEAALDEAVRILNKVESKDKMTRKIVCAEES
ncbi:MarR family transcriptional regulator [Dehalobacter sp. DCM]|uniref:MarR family winged helix-turn-helix transcriptional regulator n=1 Tax=Dehalobacter sp. DCM TaxID=2907827 RepID=UPI0030812503|nr:MarR family transcriptional regulator [Dehalobacter sp. DCM]